MLRTTRCRKTRFDVVDHSMCKHRLSDEESPAFVFIAKSACGGIRPLQACVYILVNWEYYHHSQVILGAPRSSQELPGILRIMFLISTFVRVKPCQMANTKSSAEAMCKDWEKRKGGKSCSLHQSQLGFRAAHVVHLKFIGHLKFSLGWDIRL